MQLSLILRTTGIFDALVAGPIIRQNDCRSLRSSCEMEISLFRHAWQKPVALVRPTDAGCSWDAEGGHTYIGKVVMSIYRPVLFRGNYLPLTGRQKGSHR